MPRIPEYASNTGTSTTEHPVRKADFEAVVYFPAPWSAAHCRQQEPATRQPERTAPRCKTRKLTIENHSPVPTAARLMRTALKKSGEISTSAFLMTTKFESPDQVDQNQKKCALERSGTRLQGSNPAVASTKPLFRLVINQDLSFRSAAALARGICCATGRSRFLADKSARNDKHSE